MQKKSIMKKAAATAMSVCLLASMSPAAALADDGAGASFKTWKDLYSGMGITTSQEGEGYYDTVTSATKIGANAHVGHIPSVVQKEATGEKLQKTGRDGSVSEVDAYVLTGVNVTGDESKDVKLLSGTHATFEGKQPNKTYGTDEFLIALDYDGMDYTWSDYLDKVYAVTVSDGNTTAGAVPWIDWYGEKATAGPHYNKVEVALNSGTVVADNKATVHRFDDFYDNGQLKSGKYTVTVYAEGFKPLVADNIWVAARSNVKATFEEATATSVKVAYSSELPADFQPVFTVDEHEASYADGVLSFDAVKPGSHNVVIGCGNIDAEGHPKYDAITGSFVYEAAEAAVSFNSDTKMLEAVGTDITVADYVAQISKVNVAGKDYAAAGRGSVKVINEDGSIDLSKTAAAEATEDVEITVTAAGYPALTFTYPVKAEEPADPQPADPQEEEQIDIAAAQVTVPAVTYTGKALTPAATVKLNGKTLAKGTDFDAAYSNNTNAGTAKVTITGKGSYKGTKTASFTINKAAQKMAAKAAVKTVKAKKLKKKAQTVKKAIVVKNQKGVVSYKVVKFKNKKAKKALKLNAKNGSIKVKKGTKKGTYRMTVAVTAKGDSNYKAMTKKVNVTVRVK